MEANTQYTDFKGTAAADVSDHLGIGAVDNILAVAKHFNINTDLFKPVGISIYGTEGFYVSILCVDLNRSTPGNEVIVKMSFDNYDDKEILDMIFKRLHIVLYNSNDETYKELDYVEEVNYSDYHPSDEDE